MNVLEKIFQKSYMIFLRVKEEHTCLIIVDQMFRNVSYENDI